MHEFVHVKYFYGMFFIQNKFREAFKFDATHHKIVLV